MADGNVKEISKFEKIVRKISGALVYVSFATILIMLLAYVIDGGYRLIAGKSIFGLTDIVELSLVITIFIGIAYVGSIKGHINVTLGSDRFPDNAKPVVSAISSFFGLIYIGVMTWQLGARGWRQIVNPTLTTNSLQWPIGPFLLIMALGCFVLALVLISDIYQYIRQAVSQKTGNNS
jgi:TRAP-type C4-dicarboxylate transport system permease small subunit